MRMLVVENFAGTPLGLIGRALAETGAEIDLRRMWRGETLPAGNSDYDGFVILGGEQSALDDADHPYLPALAALARTFGDVDKAVLGVCLGAQIIARGYGARNLLGRPIEFGWRTVRPTAAGRHDPVIAELGEGTPVFHWHLDTFTLPRGATHLAESDMTEQQAFRIGRAVYGIQFHFEADTALVRRWSRDFAAVIARYEPDWPRRLPSEAERYAPAADRTGMAIARAWVSLIQ